MRLDALCVRVYRALHNAVANGQPAFYVRVDETKARLDALVAHLHEDVRFSTCLLNDADTVWLACTLTARDT